MSRRKKSLIEALSIRLAVAQQNRSRRLGASKRSNRTAAAMFAAALSIGGVSEVLQSAPFAVRKDLEGVRVLRLEEEGEKLVANVSDSFAANSLYKFARLVPDRFVRQERRLFRAEWLKEESRSDQVHEQISLFNDTVRKEFFSAKIPFGDLIHEKATKYDVDPALVAAVMEQESRFKTRARSPKGAAGLMQLMPRTGAWMGAKNLYDPEQNVDAGVKYLKYLEKRFDGDLTKTVAAYNAGEGNVRRYGGKVPPFQETRTYVKKVMGNYERRQKELKDFEAETLALDVDTPVYDAR
jgi:soluble lytic murein transglycosylase-like protein